jgi:hypothetical protein
MEFTSPLRVSMVALVVAVISAGCDLSPPAKATYVASPPPYIEPTPATPQPPPGALPYGQPLKPPPVTPPVSPPITPPAAPPVAAAKPALPGWNVFQHPDGVLTISVPGRPEAQKHTMVGDLRKPIPLGAMQMSSYRANSTEMNCEVEVFFFSPEIASRQEQALMARDKIIGATNVKRSAVTWAGHPAIELVGDFDGDPTRIAVQRFMFIGNKLYIGGLYGSPGHPTAAERAAFFDSLVIK